MGSKSSVRASSIPAASDAIDSGDLAHLTTPQLVFFLKSSFLNSEFEEVSRILSSREVSMREELVQREAAKMDLESRCWALESEVAFLKSRGIELEEKLKRGGDGGLRTKAAELERMLEARELEASKFVAAEEAERYRRDHERLREQLGVGEEDCSKGRAQHESDVWKRKYGELESRCLQLVEENLSLVEKLKSMDKESRGHSRTRAGGDDFNSGRKMQHLSNLEVGSERKEGSSMHVNRKPLFAGVIDISDSDDERDAEDPGLVGLHEGGTPHIKHEPVCEKSSERMPFGLRNGNAVCNGKSSRQDNRPLAPATVGSPRRNHFSRASTQGFDCEDYDDEDDRIPLGKLKMKRLSEVSKEPNSSVNRSSGCDDTLHTATHSRNHLVPFRHCEGVKEGAKGTSSTVPSAHTLSPADTNDILEIYPDTKIASQIRRKMGTDRWEYEADMLSSLSKDPELCMKAVCAIYRRQRFIQKSAQGMLLANNRGFNTIDAYKGSRMAEFLMDGDPHGPLKKSIEELQKHNPQGLDYCVKLATHYSQQLFLIYRNKVDPYFSPS